MIVALIMAVVNTSVTIELLVMIVSVGMAIYWDKISMTVSVSMVILSSIVRFLCTQAV